MYFVEVILPLALEQTYHYIVDNNVYPTPSDITGCRVVVSFGKRRFYTGVVVNVSTDAPVGVSLESVKKVETILDDSPLVSKEQIALWFWIADYYCCSIGQVMRIALPGGLIPDSQTLIFLNEDFVAVNPLSRIEYILLDALSKEGKKGGTFERLQSKVGESISSAYDHLLSLGAIYTEELIKPRYKPRLKVYLQLSATYQSKEGIVRAYEKIGRSPAKTRLLMHFEDRLQVDASGFAGLIERDVITNGKANQLALVRKLVELGIFQIVQGVDSRIKVSERLPAEHTGINIELTKPVTLLETRVLETKELVMINLVSQEIAKGNQVLMLSPSAYSMPSASIYLQALEQAACGHLHYYHSNLNEQKRTELYKYLSSTDKPCLVLGTRSAVFLPLSRLSLIIIDEEQEYLYKQQFVTPYFHARDVSLYLAGQRGIKLLLTSMSPSAETLFNVLRGKYARLVWGNQEMHSFPKRVNLQTINLKATQRFGRHTITESLKQEIVETLAKGNRVLIIHNRRGYAPYLICRACSSPIKCPYCDVSLSYYSSKSLLSCHYCGYKTLFSNICPYCHESKVQYRGEVRPALDMIGSGVERIEDEINDLFPDARVLRLDSDSLQSSKQRLEINTQIEAGEVDIIVGTQLIKSQPIWDNIGLIAVVQLDDILGYPDFRAGERAYQFLYQLWLYSIQMHQRTDVKMVIQTTDTEHPFIAAYKLADYSAYIQRELKERERYRWSPFMRISYIIFKSADVYLLDRVAQTYALYLGQYLSNELVGPVQTPSVGRIEGAYIRQIVCRRPFNVSYKGEREAFRQVKQRLLEIMPEVRKVQIIYNIDPL